MLPLVRQAKGRIVTITSGLGRNVKKNIFELLEKNSGKKEKNSLSICLIIENNLRQLEIPNNLEL